VLIELTYAGGTLPDDARDALTGAVRGEVGTDVGDDDIRDLSFGVGAQQHSILTVSATVRETSPLAAITRLDRSLDRAMMTTGLFEEFDTTGKVLRVAPREQAKRVYRLADQASIPS
jgi:hypothetical protein